MFFDLLLAIILVAFSLGRGGALRGLGIQGYRLWREGLTAEDARMLSQALMGAACHSTKFACMLQWNISHSTENPQQIPEDQATT